MVGSSWFLKAEGRHAGLSIFIKHGIHKGESQPRNTGAFGCFPTHIKIFLFTQHWGIYSAYSFSDFMMGVKNIIPDVVDCLTIPEVQMEKGYKRHQRHSNAIPGMRMSKELSREMRNVDYVTGWWSEEGSEKQEHA